MALTTYQIRGIESGCFVENKEIYCPSCGNEMDPTELNISNWKDDNEENKCGRCNKDFNLRWTPLYTTEVIAEE